MTSSFSSSFSWFKIAHANIAYSSSSTERSKPTKNKNSSSRAFRSLVEIPPISAQDLLVRWISSRYLAAIRTATRKRRWKLTEFRHTERTTRFRRSKYMIATMRHDVLHFAYFIILRTYWSARIGAGSPSKAYSAHIRPILSFRETVLLNISAQTSITLLCVDSSVARAIARSWAGRCSVRGFDNDMSSDSGNESHEASDEVRESDTLQCSKSACLGS
mmetsp:Transcript_72645/g.151719  ORF Transcript_72645/g.151719 Transcript_72645/m.151719 type:complete len:218 (+) Transcript_72645:138-791(+)